MSTQESARDSDWMRSWLETQREWLQRWTASSAEQRVDAVRETMETWRKHLAPTSAETTGVLQKFQELLQTSFAGSIEWARLGAEGESAAPLQKLFDALPLGPAREQQMAWQELQRAAAEYQALAQQIAQAFAQVIKAALERVPQEAELRARRAEALGGIRELYDLWVSVGEQEFAKIAHDEEFVRLQARMNNALTRLRRAQQHIAEYALKQLDLPTRSELNSVHRRLRDLAARLETLERGRAPQAKPAPRKKRHAARGSSS